MFEPAAGQQELKVKPVEAVVSAALFYALNDTLPFCASSGPH